MENIPGSLPIQYLSVIYSRKLKPGDGKIWLAKHKDWKQKETASHNLSHVEVLVGGLFSLEQNLLPLMPVFVQS